MSGTSLRRDTLIGGEWRHGREDAWMDVTDPSDVEVVVAQVPALSAVDMDAIYSTAKAGAWTWRTTNPLARGAVLFAAAALLRERREAIATDLVREMGKTITEARGEVGKAAEFFEFYGSTARLPFGELLNDARPGTSTSARYEPLGVVVAITPWNDPLLTPARKLAPALAAGNAVVIKPATDTPVVALHLARALLDAGLPPAVLSVVTGRGAEIGEALLAHDSIAAVTFTGSTAVGLALQQRLAGRNLRVQTEMGGKNAAVVLADADLELAAATVSAASFGQGGQRCTATSRVIVDRQVADAFESLLLAAVAGIRIGRGLDASTTLGPLVNEHQRSEVLEHITSAQADGAVALAGGGVPSGPEYARGCYVQPTVLTHVRRDMNIWSAEVFGPVVAVHRVDGFDEALEATNDSVYGLAASIFTRSLEPAYRFLDLAEVGQVAVNLPTAGWDVHHPFGGFRQSGSAFKEQGLEALRFYTRVKTAAIRYS
jgi:aldehyde dehydrogenase (NAD+)